MIKKRVVAGIVWDRKGERILIAKRRIDDEHGGVWEFPGGGVEEGERLEEALVRELEEELGITAEVISPLPKVLHTDPGSRIVLHPFLCRHLRGEPTPIDCAEWTWIPLGELTTYRLSPPDRRIVPLIKPLERHLEGDPEAEHPSERVDLNEKDGGI